MKGDPEREVRGMEAKEGGDAARGRAGAAACAARGGLGAAFGAWGL